MGSRIARNIGFGLLLPILSGLCGSRAIGAATYTYSSLGALPGDSSTQATGINASGEIVGTSQGPSGVRVFLYQNGAMSSTGIYGFDAHINDAGQIAATKETGTGGQNIVYQDGQITPLPDNSHGSPVAINNSGVVLTQLGATSSTDGHSVTAVAFPPGSFEGNPTSINSSGQVAGTIEIPLTSNPTPSSRPTEWPLISTSSSAPTGAGRSASASMTPARCWSIPRSASVGPRATR